MENRNIRSIFDRRTSSSHPRPHTAHTVPSQRQDWAQPGFHKPPPILRSQSSYNEDKRMPRDEAASDLCKAPLPHVSALSLRDMSIQHEENVPVVASACEMGKALAVSGSSRTRRHSRYDRVPTFLGASHSDCPSISETSFSSSIATGKTASLVGKLSRKCQDTMADVKDTMAEVKENLQTIPSRLRKPSIPDTNMAASASSNPTAISPSKRAGRSDNSQSKKSRPNFILSFGDRKDTPTPATRPAGIYSASTSVGTGVENTSLWPASAGQEAKKAVAAYKSARGGVDEEKSDQRLDLDARRARVGSLSSAADSGADLSSFGEQHYLRGDSDIEMENMEPPFQRAASSAYDFVAILPVEMCLRIFSYLDANTLTTAELVSKQWQELCSDSSVWRSVFLARFHRQVYTQPPPIQIGGAGVGQSNLQRQPRHPWRQMYRARVQLEKHWRAGARGAGKAIYLSGHTDSVYCVQFDEKKIVTGSRDRTIRVWDIETYECLRVIGGPNVRPITGPKQLRTVEYPAFHVAMSSVNGTPRGDAIFHTPSEWHEASILCLQYDDQILVTGSSDHTLLVWDITTYEPIRRLRQHSGGVLDVALDAKHIVSCSKDSKIIVWDRETYEVRGELVGHRGPVNAVQLRGKLLVSASGDGIARLWDVEKMRLIKEFPAKERGLAAVEFSEDMKYVLAGGNDHITYKFDTETGEEVQQFLGHTQLVRSLWLDSANNRVVSGSYDLDLRVYDMTTAQELWRAEEWTTSWMLAAKSDYRRIVATSQDGRILVVDFGLHQGGPKDASKIDGLDLLRGVD